MAPHARIFVGAQLPEMRPPRRGDYFGGYQSVSGHPDLVVHTISPEFEVIKATVYWHRIMFRCTCEEVFAVIRRPRSMT
jgi:hypothetical protein